MDSSCALLLHCVGMWRRHCLRVVFASWSNSRFTYHFDHVLNISMYFILKMCLPFCIHHQLVVFFSFSAKYIGCYVDDTQKRALRGVSFFDYKKMTVFRCQDNCAERYDSNKLQKTLIHEISLFFSSLFVFLLSGWEIKWKSWCWQWLKGAPSFRARMIKDLMARYWLIQACHRYAVYLVGKVIIIRIIKDWRKTNTHLKAHSVAARELSVISNHIIRFFPVFLSLKVHFLTPWTAFYKEMT